MVILLVFQASEKNPGILRFGSLSVKVKKTTKAVNNYFGSEKKHSLDSNMNNGFLSGINSGSSSNVANAAASLFDADRMPPPKFAPSKKTRQVFFLIDDVIELCLDWDKFQMISYNRILPLILSPIHCISTGWSDWSMKTNC